VDFKTTELICSERSWTSSGLADRKLFLGNGLMVLESYVKFDIGRRKLKVSHNEGIHQS